MTDTNALRPSYSKAMKALGKDVLTTTKPLGSAISEMILHDDLHNNGVVMLFTVNHLNPDTGFGDDGAKNFAQATVVRRWMSEYADMLEGRQVTTAKFWKAFSPKIAERKSNGKATGAGFLVKGQTSPEIRLQLDHARKAALGLDQVTGPETDPAFAM